ncbi:DUF262 domain-containing protein [Arthrobacter zhaoguopingii]|uniref:DUF262 domain-containing protein n=1 Tax=Arthrobacter zhaoguopingii TaxID=2681491 RepID=UPI0013579E5E|nr:DUF262 domain-containing protein [Arthrobacter zhaoguopingii]
MEALNRPLKDWFTSVAERRLRLPRFQRFEAWSHNEVGSLLETVLRKLPAGAVLVLKVGAEEPFASRELESAPAFGPGDRVTEHLLDGQQRLTALWRAMHDNYSNRTYFIRFENGEEEGTQPAPRVLGQYRWTRGGKLYPLWCEDPVEVYRRGYIPLRLLNPLGDDRRNDWALTATDGDFKEAWNLNVRVQELAASVSQYNIPYLSLPEETPKDVALDVFIKMNTSSVRLSAFDIVVAQLEEATGSSLHELVEDLHAAVPTLHRYIDGGTLALDCAALRSDRAPNQRSYQRMNISDVAGDWDEIIAGIKWAVEMLDAERIYDAQRLPSVASLPIIAALHRFFPSSLDEAGNARRLMRAYLWRSFLTRRYDQSAATRALQDYRGLRRLLIGEESDWKIIPIFDPEVTPLPTEDDLIGAAWPRGREVLARGLLAVALREGARDVADDQTVTASNLSKREYHHLFPDSLLLKIGKVEQQKSMRALNCALISWSTNRNISNKSPLQYLQDRIDRSDIGENVVRARLTSHLIPYAELAEAGPYLESDSERLVRDYDNFLAARARMVLPVVRSLCEGTSD